MKKLFLLSCFVFIVFPVRAADQVITIVENSLVMKDVSLHKLPDGGCSVVAWGDMAQSDGGLLLSVPSGEPIEVSGVNRTDCLNIIDVRAKALFKAGRF